MTQTMTFCPHCHQTMCVHAKTCTRCGARLLWSAAEAAAMAAKARPANAPSRNTSATGNFFMKLLQRWRGDKGQG